LEAGIWLDKIFEIKLKNSLKMRVEQLKRRKPKRRTMVVEKSFRQIDISEKVFYQNMRTYKGSRTDTNLLNIKFKTIICRILEEMCQAKEVLMEEIASIIKYKQAPPSFNSLIHLIYSNIEPCTSVDQDSEKGMMRYRKYSPGKRWEVKSPNILRRLRELFESSEITRKVYSTEGTLVNKLLMLKYLEAIRYTVIGKGEIVKWKELKSVTVLK
jgi:hypothetical protein